MPQDNFVRFFTSTWEETIEADERAMYKIEKGSVLHAYSRSRFGWEHVNPNTFGEVFANRGLISGVKSALAVFPSFVIEEHVKSPYLKFDFEAHDAKSIFYFKDEHGFEASQELVRILSELFLSSFPIYYQWVDSKHTYILYDGFYGEDQSLIYLPAHSATTYAEMVSGFFGIARKDTLRESRNLSSRDLNLAYFYRDLLSPDVIIQCIKEKTSDLYDYPVKEQLYQNLLKVSPTVRKNLLLDFVTGNNSWEDTVYMEDSLRMLAQVPEENLKRLKGTKTWLDLHNRVMNLIDADENAVAKIKIPEKLLNVARESLYSDLQIIPLLKAREFVEVGKVLNICIGKNIYYSKAVAGESYCFTGIIGGESKYAIEVLQDKFGLWKVQQFVEYSNARPENWKTLVSALEEAMNSKED